MEEGQRDRRQGENITFNCQEDNGSFFCLFSFVFVSAFKRKRGTCFIPRFVIGLSWIGFSQFLLRNAVFCPLAWQAGLQITAGQWTMSGQKSNIGFVRSNP